MPDKQENTVRESLREKGVVVKVERAVDYGGVTMYEIIGAAERDGREVEFHARGDSTYNALRALNAMVGAV